MKKIYLVIFLLSLCYNAVKSEHTKLFINLLTLDPEPTVNSSNISFSSVTSNSARVSWFNKGNGSRKIVVAKAGWFVHHSRLPVDGKSYSADNYFGNGFELGFGNYVVYDGIENSFIINGLSEGIEYYFAVIEYNGTGTTTNYLTTGYPQAKIMANSLINCPPPSSLSANVTPHSTVTVNWDHVNVPNPSYKLHYIAENSTTVHRSDVFDNKAVLSNLQNNTRYFWYVQTVCTGDGKVGSDIASPISEFISGPDEGICAAPTGLSVSSSIIDGFVSATFSWSAVPGAEEYYVQYGPTANIVYSTTNEVTIKGLDPNTIYTWRARSSCSSDRTIFSNLVNGPSFNTVSEGIACNIPTNLKILCQDYINGVVNVSFSWEAVAGSNKYNFWYRKVGGQRIFVDNTPINNSYLLKGLNPGTKYEWGVQNVCNPDGSAISNLTFGTTFTTTTTSTSEPTIPSSDLIFTKITSNSITLKWNNTGDGVRRIIVANKGWDVHHARLPVDGKIYNANSVMGAGSFLGFNNFVVFDGDNSQNSLTVTGLDPETIYGFGIFEYNCAGGKINYLTSSYPKAKIQTSPENFEPTVTVSNISFSNITDISMTLSWESPGVGTQRLVIAKANSPIEEEYLPEDYSVYTASTTFGLGSNLGNDQYVVFNANHSANTFTIKGLTPNTNYYFALIEYNGTGPATDYLTSTYPTANDTTIAPTPEPTIASSKIIFESISSNSITLKWTNGNGSRRLVVINNGWNVHHARLPVDRTTYTANSELFLGSNLGFNNYVVFDGDNTQNSLTVTGLSPESIYGFGVFEYNGSGEMINYLTSSYPMARTTTSPIIYEPTIAASNITFGNILDISMDVNWENTGNGSRSIVVARAGNPIDHNNLPVDGMSYIANATFGLGSDLGNGHYVVGNVENFISNVKVKGLNPLSIYYYAVIEFNGISGATNYLTSSYPVSNSTTLAATPEPTVASSKIIFESISSNSITLKWTNGNGSRRLVVINNGWNVHHARLPGDRTTYTANSELFLGSNLGFNNYVVFDGDNSQNSLTVTGLSPESIYGFGVFEYNGSGEMINYLTSSYPMARTITPSNNILSFNLKSEEDINSKEISSPRLIIYPNPASKWVNIQLDSFKEYENKILIFNVLGSKVYTKTIKGSINEIVNVSEFQKGIYLINIITDNQILLSRSLIIH